MNHLRTSPSDLRTTINDYLQAECSQDRPEIEALADQITLGEKPLGESIALVPVGGDEHRRWIGHAAAVYAGQRPPEGGLTVVLGLNGQLERPRSLETGHAVRAAQNRHPKLDLRVMDMGNFSSFTEDGKKINCIMSALRRKLGAGVLAALLRQDLADTQDPLFHINDIDLRMLSDDYFITMRRAQQQNPGHPLTPNARHALFPSKPYLSALIAFCDMDGIFSPEVPIFEPAVALSATTYCGAGGYGDTGEIGETIDLLGRTRKPLLRVAGAELQTSGRRHEQIFKVGCGVIWPKDFDFEGLTYRSQMSLKDISPSAFLTAWDSTYVSNDLQYKADIDRYVALAVAENPSAPFEQIRDHFWAWAKARLAAAEPFIADYERLIASKATDENSHAALCENMSTSLWSKNLNLRTAIGHVAHRQGVMSLSRAFGVEDVALLAEGGFERSHSFFLAYWREVVRADCVQRVAINLFDELYAETAGASL